ncbi:hypothetical protein Terro_4189 [Terriglobus roseus DSM 18391]|uniref:Uncharacterized protein n=1 Tax=Terriglobus roseus (strain DSM 18391 / NRRL B-41598 / KBS 63) TaxID=926566 RepID=I3ZMC6_TERRK|nr:hypothetical protein [Terriglobus roseus]AFL90394.1 hypothetical protein Terro_4189 [Terriglobus roseus DSM 18391]
MSLISRSTGIHNHLAPRKKHLSSHSGSHAAQDAGGSTNPADMPQRERPFAPLQFDEKSEVTSKPPAYKSIFHL